MYNLGVDVSHWQGKMDWNKAKTANVKFAMLKITEGDGYYDDTFAHNYDQCMNLSIPVGYYHFVRSNISAEGQFKWLKSKLPTISNTNIALDCESHGGQQNANKTTDTIITLSNMLEDLIGARPIIYTSRGYANYYMLPWNMWKKHRLWIANWTTAAEPALPKHWDDWYIWQYEVHAPGSDYGAYNSTAIDVNRMRATEEPEEPPSSEIIATLNVKIGGVDYIGTTVLKQV